MSSLHFLSYSRADGNDLALRLHQAMRDRAPEHLLWVDRKNIRPGEDWDDQIAAAIATCDSLLFTMTDDSVQPQSGCKLEWHRALKCKKPVIPLLGTPEAEMPFGLGRRQFIDFTGDFDSALLQLCGHLKWLASSPGTLQAARYRLEDARRDLPRATNPAQTVRIEAEIAELERQIAELTRVVEDPSGAERRVEIRIARELELIRQPDRPTGGTSTTRFINPPPGIAPSYFQDRKDETKRIGDFLKTDALRLLTVVGRGGVGKTALTCRVLKALEGGRLPDESEPFHLDGIVYLSATSTSSHPVCVSGICHDLALFAADANPGIVSLLKDPYATTEAKMRSLLECFPGGRTVLLLDNFEDALDPETRNVRDRDLFIALEAIMNAPHHGVKVIVTTRTGPRDLALVQPGRQTHIQLDEGLPLPYARELLRARDVDGKLGLKSAQAEVLDEACRRTRGYPRALEALVSILDADRSTSLSEILDDTRNALPENVVEVVVGEAFSRLDTGTQRVIQALAVYGRPVPPVATDYMLRPFLHGVDSAPVLNRLVNMHFVRKEAGRYYLHPIDRAYALQRIPRSNESDASAATADSFSLTRLRTLGARYFEQARIPRTDWRKVDDLDPLLAEFDLRMESAEYETAAHLLLGFDWDYLYVWGSYQLMAELHERLRERLDDPSLRIISLNTLGAAYAKMGRLDNAIAAQEMALSLARKTSAVAQESACLNNLALRYLDVGLVDRAMHCCSESLPLARRVSRPEEEAALRNLGACYAELGQTGRSLQLYDQSLAIGQQLGDRRREAIALDRIAYALVDQDEWAKAIEGFTRALMVADDISFAEVQNASRLGLALAYLISGNLVAARASAEAALAHEVPKNSHRLHAILSLIALGEGDLMAARDQSHLAIRQSDAMLAQCAKFFSALDTKGLALCGLTLCGEPTHRDAAIEAYTAARSITKAPGVIHRSLQLFNLLVRADSRSLLGAVRKVVKGLQ